MSGKRRRRPGRAKEIRISPAFDQGRNRVRTGLTRTCLMMTRLMVKKDLNSGRSRHLDRHGLPGLHLHQGRENRGLAFPLDALRLRSARAR